MTLINESHPGKLVSIAASLLAAAFAAGCSKAPEGEMGATQDAPASSEPASGTASAPDAQQKLQDALNGAHRSAENKARDVHRHPVETLTFFGIEPDMTVVELWPFGGWYTEVLAPYLKGSGTLYAAGLDPESTGEGPQRYNAQFQELLAAHPDVFSEVQMSVLSPDTGKMEIAPEGTADLVVTFRNVHNWLWAGDAKDVFAAAFRALKPGGVLGVVEHRHNDPNFEAKERGQAYVGEDYAIALIESVGFKLEGRSDINNNPKDTKDYPKGVWTLPPAYAEGDKDREKYEAIGESDRFTLKFVKPAATEEPAAET